MADVLMAVLFVVISVGLAWPRGIGIWLAALLHGYDDAWQELEAAREARRWESKP